MILILLLSLAACALAEPEGYYQPAEFADMDMSDPASQWCFARSRESEHFICLWEVGFGGDPNGNAVPAKYRVDVDDLLDKAEQFYHTNVDVVRMADTGLGRSQLDRYKMQIYLLYTDEWVATGAGYDNVIGALWVSPMTCQPVGSVIAHEVGHCFQYQVYCDQLLNGALDEKKSGFRYGYPGSNGGNGFWEQCAQWVSFIDYPMMSVDAGELGDWFTRCNLAFEHEDTRYESYWLQRYIALKRGPEAIGRIWRESAYPEDALSAYCRLYLGCDVDALNDELFQYACAMVTGELLPKGTENVAPRFETTLYPCGDGWLRVGYASCPEVGGFNVIDVTGASRVSLDGLAAGSALAEGDLQEQGRYNDSDVALGWRWGVVSGDKADEWTVTKGGYVPDDVREAYLVVVGAPGELCVNPWDDDAGTDVQFPYQVKIE